MNIEDAKELKTIAENQIVDILNRLEKETECVTSSITITNVEEEGFGTHLAITVKRNVNIILEVK